MIHTNNNETDCNYKKIAIYIYIFRNKQLILQINVTRNWILQDDFDMSCRLWISLLSIKNVIINNTIYLFPGALGMLHSSEIPRTFYSSSLPYFTIRDLQLHCNGKYRFRIKRFFHNFKRIIQNVKYLIC